MPTSRMKPYYQDDLVTLYHGDCREVTKWLTADVLVTDPPYGMGYVSNRSINGASDAIAGDLDPSMRDTVLQLWGTRPAVVFGTWRVAHPAAAKAQAVWWKRAAAAGMGDLKMPWGSSHEEIYFLGAGFVGSRRASVVVTDEPRGGMHGQAAKYGHPTPKPVGLMEQLVETCPPGVIADPFAGSGATLIAARNLGRTVIGIEVVEQYCEGIVRRLSEDVLDFGGAA